MRADLRSAVLVVLGAAACSDAPFIPVPPIDNLPPDLAAITFAAQGTPVGGRFSGSRIR